MNTIDDFFREKNTGKCKNSSFEVGSMYRKQMNCMFCINGYCHFVGDCDRRKEEFSGWDIS